MSLATLLENVSEHKKIGISEERIDAIKPALREYIAFWREYPDMFVDFMQTGYDAERNEKLTFRLRFYQRVKRAPLLGDE